MSEPENPRWLNDASRELQQDVPVRAAWRSRLLAEIARAPQPTRGDDVDDRFDVEPLVIEPASRRRSIVLSPLVGLAAAAVFVALGAGITYRVMSSRAPRTTVAESGPPRTGLTPVSVSTDREVVRFELSAPSAARVSVVGSFNEWNPAATPLVRDPATGTWMVSLPLAPGRHVYAFVVDGAVRADPTAPRAADDDFGSTNSVVFVSSPRT